MMKQTKAFTLVELLVVVAIIALLVSILMPTLNKAKEQARRVICASNLRNCGTNLHIYAASNDGFFPPADWNNDGGFQANCYYNNFHSGEPGAWDLREFVRPFVGNFEIWKCAALPMAASIDDSANSREPARYGTYQYFPGRRWPQFAKTGTEQYNNPKPAPHRTAHADATAGRVMMQDVFEEDWAPGSSMLLYNHGKGATVYDWGLSDNPSCACRLGPGGDGANLLFYDTHAEWVGSSELEPVGKTSEQDSTILYSVLPR